MKTEREFLHDISSPVATALFLIDSIPDSSQAEQNEKLEKLKKKLTEIQHFIEQRRIEIKKNASS